MKKIGPKIKNIYILFLLVFTLYVILDSFVIARTVTVVSDDSTSDTASVTAQALAKTLDTENIVSSSDYYSDGNITISLEEFTANDTIVYAATVSISDPSLLKTALAQNAYGKNVTEETSDMAEENDAILAINGDYYGAREKGYVIKNGVLYRSIADSDREDLAVYSDGSFEIIKESEISAQELIDKGVYNLFSFGPALTVNGEITVDEDDEVGKAMASNPRTAIGIKENGDYVFVVSDGRTDESEGLSIYELAQIMNDLGCVISYNLDGGGSSTMYFNGNIINNPTTNGNKISERKVSDIVYIGY